MKKLITIILLTLLASCGTICNDFDVNKHLDEKHKTQR